MVTSADVARQAGVSRATVSYVLNDVADQKISATTRQTILRVADELGYRPNAAARSLRTGRGNAVIFPLPGATRSRVLSELIETCTEALAARGLTLVADNACGVAPAEQVDAWLRLHPAAVLDLLLRPDDPVIAALHQAGVLVLSAQIGNQPHWFTAGDAFAVEERLTQLRHLLDQGHRRIVFVGPEEFPTDARVVRRMMKSMARVAAASGAEIALERVDSSAATIRALVHRWQADGLPDGVCGHTDELAIAVITALISAGLRVPEDVAVIGVDDDPLARLVTPSLTTVAADYAAYAQAIAEAVTNALDGGDASARLPMPSHHLIVRDSA